jgi:lipopolysaccharide transport system ATP-binding protein
MSSSLIKLEGVSKKFCSDLKRSLFYGVADLASELCLRQKERNRLRKYEFWALKDISVEVRAGETLGLIGHNGAGKSTILKLLNGLLKPDTGYIEYQGRIGALIELGAGFSPILTGRENIYINGAVLGLSKKEVDQKLEQIIDFAELGDFIDTPVKNYSSGMRVRLGFSIASHMNPEILLIDEVLSVGDASFRKRCVDRLLDFKNNGGSIIFVSHNMTAVEHISDKVMLIDKGGVKDCGTPSEVIMKYHRDMLRLSEKADDRLAGSRITSEVITIDKLSFKKTSGESTSEFNYGDPVEIQIDYTCHCEVEAPYFFIKLQRSDNVEPMAMFAMHWDRIELGTLSSTGSVKCLLKNTVFAPGNYGVTIGVLANPSSQLGKKWHVQPREYGAFHVTFDKLRTVMPGLPSQNIYTGIGPVILPHIWKLNGTQLNEDF